MMTIISKISLICLKRYQHRLCLDGTPLNYYAVVGRKQEPVSDTFIEQYQ